MGIASRAVAKHVGYHHTPVAGERLVRRAGSMYDKTSSDWLRRWYSCVFLTAPPATASYVTRRGWSSTIALSMAAKAPTTKWQLGKIFGKIDEVRWFETRGMCGVCKCWRNVF